MMTVERIRVTENEREIFDLLLRAVRNFSPKTELRVAGGWVRDKLLGQDSSDIDIAISNMLPSDFLAKLNDYLRSQGEDEVQGHVIVSKPAQGEKKPPLETVKMSLYNHSIDLVHLRRDKDARNSRIPVKVEFASPEEDAKRRDLTINSLFYNLHTGLVEDLTGRGIDDLKSGRIATLYAALLLPFRKMVCKEKKRKSAPVVNYILKVSMKRKSSDAETVVNLHRATGRFLSLIRPQWRTSGRT